MLNAADIRRDGKTGSNSTKPILGAEASAELRDRLLAELNELGSGDDAAIWAHRSLVEKNSLTAADAQRVEETFQARLATFTTHCWRCTPKRRRNPSSTASRWSSSGSAEESAAIQGDR